MGTVFLPRMVNGPFDDSALFVQFRHQNRAVLFDLGSLFALSPRDILKITHIFVSHTHMDHFFGFDHVLRLMLGREKKLVMVGPPGFLGHVAGKLSGYCWNLVKKETHSLVLHVMEVHPQEIRSCRYPSWNGFQPDEIRCDAPFDGVVADTGEVVVRAVHLDHGIPVLAFSLHEHRHLHIHTAALEALGLVPGPWLSRLKSLVHQNAPPETEIVVPGHQHTAPRLFRLGDLAAATIRIVPGKSLAYVTDTAGTPENMEKIIHLAKDADDLFIEAVFSHADGDLARHKNHLTARQAGEIAGLSRAGRYHLFHFSPRYAHFPEVLTTEAREAFDRVRKKG
ncbi:ribonuclease Z [Desulfosarcina sp. OttesenSCG-928-A07]|nr:ribonuclease Z [Desulfosarcina sp. OttesenSCG-928-G17]MDL2329436.1 ribonuclease Z [Desulfosarcina sp. OttesenSCG-928-A07]